KLSQTFGGKEPLKWETVQCETPNRGQPIRWRRIVVDGEQAFRYINSDTSQQLPGKFELYAYPVKHDEAKGDSIDVDAPYLILIGWRAADAIQGQAPINDWAQRAGGTLTGGE
ncbi:MAG TPA: hypothetical protein VHY20_14995, partial [Pirellulales bacterium]|nr:hypothetical protein [Pirellulales bacterium]